jgi:hypothetical protein
VKKSSFSSLNCIFLTKKATSATSILAHLEELLRRKKSECQIRQLQIAVHQDATLTNSARHPDKRPPRKRHSPRMVRSARHRVHPPGATEKTVGQGASAFA